MTSTGQKLIWRGTPPTGNGSSTVLYSTLSRANRTANWKIEDVVALRKKRMFFGIFHDAAGTLQLHAADSKTGTLRKVRDSGSLAAGATADQVIWYVAPYAEFELRWINGAVDQTVFDPFFYFDDENILDV